MVSPRSVLVFSSINQDVTLTLSTFPAAGETVFADALTTSLGGKGANVATAAANSQAAPSVHIIAAVGEDVTPQLQQLQSYGVDTSYVSTVPSSTTGRAFVLLEKETAQNRIIVHPGANLLLKENVTEPLLHAFPTAVVVLQLEIAHHVSQHIAVRASTHGAIVIFNPSPVPKRTDPLFQPHAPIWSHAHIIIVNEVELQLLTDVSLSLADSASSFQDACAPGIEQLRTRCRQDAKIVVTLGSRGVVYSEAVSQIAFVPAVEIENVVDTTAAGDTFTGFLAAALGRGDSFDQCVRMAVVAAGLCVTNRGATDSIPTADQVSSALERARF